MSYVLVFMTNSTRPLGRRVRDLSFEGHSYSLDNLIMYLIHNNHLIYSSFAIVKKEDFLEQQNNFKNGLPLDKYIALRKINGKYKVFGTYKNELTWSLKYIENYNNYADLGKEKVYKLYKEKGGKGSYRFTFESTMIKYIIKGILNDN